MGQERLTDLSILYIEKDLTNIIDIKEVIRIFAQTERRIMLEWTNFKQKYQLIYIDTDNTQFYKNKCSCIM